LISLLSRHSLKEINERFYELVNISPQAEQLTVNMKEYDKLTQNSKEVK